MMLVPVIILVNYTEKQVEIITIEKQANLSYMNIHKEKHTIKAVATHRFVCICPCSSTGSSLFLAYE